MTTQRADYLRRAIPRLSEQYQPAGIVATWVDEVGDLILTPWQRRIVSGLDRYQLDAENYRRTWGYDRGEGA